MSVLFAGFITCQLTCVYVSQYLEAWDFGFSGLCEHVVDPGHDGVIHHLLAVAQVLQDVQSVPEGTLCGQFSPTTPAFKIKASPARVNNIFFKVLFYIWRICIKCFLILSKILRYFESNFFFFPLHLLVQRVLTFWRTYFFFVFRLNKSKCCYLLISCQSKARVRVRFPAFRSWPAIPTRENLASFFPNSTA